MKIFIDLIIRRKYTSLLFHFGQHLTILFRSTAISLFVKNCKNFSKVETFIFFKVLVASLARIGDPFFKVLVAPLAWKTVRSAGKKFPQIFLFFALLLNNISVRLIFFQHIFHNYPKNWLRPFSIFGSSFGCSSGERRHSIICKSRIIIFALK